jgi:hypothetical protein
MDSQGNTGSSVLRQDTTERRYDSHQSADARASGADNDYSTQVMSLTEPLSSAFDPQMCIPWLSGTDAAATTTANIFEQFDIPFWMGDDQYSSLLNLDL